VDEVIEELRNHLADGTLADLGMVDLGNGRSVPVELLVKILLADLDHESVSRRRPQSRQRRIELLRGLRFFLSQLHRTGRHPHARTAPASPG
jgi:hypothetical protein